jgi:hypothetical protein
MVMTKSAFTRVPQLLRGSVVTQRRRCGKVNCRCADGEQLHESPALSYSAGGRTRTLVLSEADVPAVTAAVQRYRAQLAELERTANAGIAALTDRLAAERAAGSARRGR